MKVTLAYVTIRSMRKHSQLKLFHAKMWTRKQREAQREYRRTPRGLLIRHRQNLKQYGLDENDYAKLLERQAGVCAICKTPPKTRRLAVDHDHGTGEVRGLLCPRCNRCIGLFQDRADLLSVAVSYLKHGT